ncbi:Patellin-3 [Morella rubra]|uniref:Patellin-3 n=1 Tax=Morella rubra TaxID=262757 RepID=A0A6A1WMT7_9ROSI|nr:Patellin-3 [Morella rubra]
MSSLHLSKKLYTSSFCHEQPPPPPAKDAEDQKADSPSKVEEKEDKPEALAPLTLEERFQGQRCIRYKKKKNTVHWRKEFEIDELLEEDLGSDLKKVVFMLDFDKEGHPVCYNVYGEFQKKELYQKTFFDEEKRQKFLRRRILFLERSIRKLDFSLDGISTIVQVNDLKNSRGPSYGVFCLEREEDEWSVLCVV